MSKLVSNLVTIPGLQRYVILRPFGSINATGSMCHFNALLQSLFSCPAFIRAMIEEKNYFVEKCNVLGCILSDSCAFLIDSNVSDSDYQIKSSKISHIILNALEKTFKEKNINTNFGERQECAHEGLTLLLDMIDSKKISKLFEQEHTKTIICDNCNHTVEQTDRNIYHNTGGQHITDEQTFVFNWYTKKEKLNDYICDNCKQKGSTIITKASTINKIVVIMFEKFYRKTLEFFPNNFEILSTSEQHISINAVSQICHVGGMGGGHYFAIASRGNTFYEFNDSNVTEKNMEPNPLTFMVFYHISY